MAWNEPGKDGQDPWGGGKNDGPPDLEDVIRNIRDKIGGRKGGKPNGRPRNTDGNPGGFDFAGIGLFAGVALLVWLLSGIYIIGPAERGVVLQFGKYKETTMPGPHWHIPTPFQHVEKVDVEASRNANIGFRTADGRRSAGGAVHSESLMLTQDENIIDLKIAVQYRIKKAEDYLFNVRNPDLTLRQMTESAVRETVGQSDMDFILTEGRSEISSKIEIALQEILDARVTGLVVTSVNMQDVQPPEEVQAAFDDVVKAREDKIRQVNEAEAYANDIVPRARGAAFRIEQEAEGFKSEVLAKAYGESSRFSQVREEYEQAPAITQERLYLESMEAIYQNSQKVMINLPANSNNMLYLPLDKMMGGGSKGGSSSAPPPPMMNVLTPNTASTQQDDLRRGGR